MSPFPAAVVRSMSASDADAVARLSSQLGYPASEGDIRRRYDGIKDRQDARLLVAESSDDIVGWIQLQATYLLASDPRVEIWGLVVDVSARGRGVGRLLVEAAEQWARDLGLGVVSLRSNSLRVATKGFYEHLGYVIVKNQNAFRKTL